MDCTCKTNVYKILLCIITGVTPLNTIYYIAFAFLSAEMVHDYHWVLGAIKKLYELFDIPDSKSIITNIDPSIICAISDGLPLASHLLCLWHMNQNIMTNCSKLFEDKKSWEKFYGEWHHVVYAHTEQKFVERWDVMKQKYEDYLGFPAYYLEDEIIRSHRYKLICFYTNQVTYFRNTSTSRVKRQYAKLKTNLVSSISKNTSKF